MDWLWTRWHRLLMLGVPPGHVHEPKNYRRHDAWWSGDGKIYHRTLPCRHCGLVRTWCFSRYVRESGDGSLPSWADFGAYERPDYWFGIKPPRWVRDD